MKSCVGEKILKIAAFAPLDFNYDNLSVEEIFRSILKADGLFWSNYVIVLTFTLKNLLAFWETDWTCYNKKFKSLLTWLLEVDKCLWFISSAINRLSSWIHYFTIILLSRLGTQLFNLWNISQKTHQVASWKAWKLMLNFSLWLCEFRQRKGRKSSKEIYNSNWK